MKKISLFGICRLSREERASSLEERFPKQAGFNGYFHTVGTFYRIVEFLFLFLFLGFLAISAMGNLSGITYRNAEYLFRNFGVTLDANRASSTELIYSPDTGMAFASGGKGFSVCGETGVSVFSATGRNYCTEAMELHSPCIRAAGKYTLVFENNGFGYCLFGPYSMIYSGKSETPIRGASIAENGTYALISAAEDYTSAVTVYDSDFSPVNRYLKNTYVVSAELDTAGERLVITALGTLPSGAYRTEITAYSVGKTEEDGRQTYEGLFPLRSFPAGEAVYTVFSQKLFCRTPSFSYEISFENGTVEDIACSEGAIAVLLSCRDADGAPAYRIVQFDKDFRSRDSGIFSASFCRIAKAGNRTFLLTETGLRYFEDGRMSEPQTPKVAFSAESALLAYSDQKVYLAGKSAAYLIEVK